MISPIPPAAAACQARASRGHVTSRLGRRRGGGFTLIELIVALSIAAFMVTLFYGIFNEATKAVSRGTQASDIITKARAFQRELAFETQTEITTPGDYSVTPNAPASYESRMLGPKGPVPADTENGGVLVIVNHAIANVAMTRRRLAQGRFQTVRSDQLMFFYDQVSPKNPDLPNVSPSYSDTYGGDPRFSDEADAVRLWYGHVKVVNPDNTPATGNLGNTTPSDPNAPAARWVLGRQAMFIRNQGDEDSQAISTTGAIHATGGSGSDSGFGPLNSVTNLSGSGQVFQGYTDLTSQTMERLTGAPPAPATAFLPAASSDMDYHERVLGMGSYAGHGLIYNDQRLQVVADPRGSGFEADTIARVSPYFIQGISDFIVDWAADYDNDNDPTNGYGGRDKKMDRNTDGSIRWYNLIDGPSGDATRDPDYSGPTSEYFPKTYTPPKTNPAYVAPTEAGQYSTAPDGTSGGAMVWGHEDTTKAHSGADNWPFLIRIRYRVHDGQAEFSGRPIEQGTPQEYQELGQWFQVIIPVNRQPSP